MTRRRASRESGCSIEALVDRLPSRFLEPTIELEDGVLVSLHEYIRDLDQWLRDELGLPPVGAPSRREPALVPVPEVMTIMGCPVSEWYRLGMRIRPV